MAFDREAAKAAGYSDEEINAFLQANPKIEKEKATEKVPVGEPPAPTTVIPEVETGLASAVTTAGLAAAPYVIPAAGAAAAAAGGGKLYGAWKASADAAQALADAKMASEQGIAQRAAQRAGQATQAVRPGPTPTYNVPTQNVPQVTRPAVPMGGGAPAPVAPQAAPAMPAAPQAQAPSMMDKTTSMIRQLAANKVISNLAKGGMGVAAAVTPGNVGQNYNFPMTGPLKGSEINPQTGRPWTPQELQQYNQMYR